MNDRQIAKSLLAWSKGLKKITFILSLCLKLITEQFSFCFFLATWIFSSLKKPFCLTHCNINCLPLFNLALIEKWLLCLNWIIENVIFAHSYLHFSINLKVKHSSKKGAFVFFYIKSTHIKLAFFSLNCLKF